MTISESKKDIMPEQQNIELKIGVANTNPRGTQKLKPKS